MLTFQGLILFMAVVRFTIAPISLCAQAFTRLHGALGSGRRVLDTLRRSPGLADGTLVPSGFSAELRLDHVTFGYTADRPILHDVSVNLRRGELLAVVGASGAGKSTLVDLVLRLYDPQSGQVRLDGIDIREFVQAEYRKLFGVVSQESLLFNDTIRNNIIFGRPTGDEADLNRAADIANAAEFISALPEGYETVVGDRGIRLSGGQRQRMAIARAIYAKPQILILDEATSALDSTSERLVQEAIDRVLTHATAIVIAHRLSTIMHADRIVVLNAGRIEAVGCHDELLQTSTTYRKFCELQASSSGPRLASATSIQRQ
jgi:ABC-type multidrug transport system fused ATPase/permease subunit